MKHLLGILASLCLIIVVHYSSHAQSLQSESITIGFRDTLYSEVLDQERIIFIHGPEDYQQLDNVPLVIVLDADSQFKQTVSTIDYISNGAQGNDIIPASIVIGITSPNRDYDFTPVKGLVGLDSSSIANTGGAFKFLSFITDELIPHVDTTYNTCNNRTLIGHSLGGLFVFHALLEKPDYFANYLALDPALGFADGVYLDKVLDALDDADLSSENLYYASADNRPKGMTDEELENTSDQFLQNMDKAHLRFRKYEASQQWQLNLKTVHYADEDHFSVPLPATYDAMRYFYDYYKFDEMIDLFFTADSTTEINMVNRLKKHYSTISENMGCEVIPQLDYLNSWAWGYGEDTRTRSTAHDMFRYGIELYPDLPEPYSNYGYFLYTKGDYLEAVKQYDKCLELEKNDELLEFRNQISKRVNDQSDR